MKTSQAGLDLIMNFEGWSDVPYADIVGIPTIGYGHVILSDEIFGKITREQGLNLLKRDVARIAEIPLAKYVKVELLQNEYDALASLIYNIGGEDFKKSTLLKLINAGRKEECPAEFEKWCFAGGKKVGGLLSRRKIEAKMFQNSHVPLEPTQTA